MDEWAKLFGYTGDIHADLAIALLILARLLSILVLTPFLGGKLVPNQVKVATAVSLSLLLFPIVKYNLPPTGLPPLGPMFGVYVVKEVFIGVTIGFIASLLFQALEAAGNFLDTARGSSIANVLVPQLEEQGPIFAQLKVQLGIVLFLVMNGHHYFLRAVFRSFTVLPIDTFPYLGGTSMAFPDFIIRASANLFVVGMLIVIPALIAIFMVDVVLGIANRAAPQINVFFLGMPIKGYVGIIFALLGLNYLSQILTGQFRLMLRDLNYLIQFMGHK
jgi:flagellar biosynthetic protein FliR